MKKKLVVLTVVIVMAVGAISLWAAEEKREMHMMKGHNQEMGMQDRERGEFMLKELKLTDIQKTDIQKIKLKFQKDIIPTEAKIKELRIDLKEAFINKDVEEQKVLGLIEQIGKQEIIIKQKKASESFEMLKLLTDEQKEKFRGSRMFGGMGMENPMQGRGGKGEGMMCK